MFLQDYWIRSRSFVLLAPENEGIGGFSDNSRVSKRLHSQLLGELQRLRGRVYLTDGAVSAEDLDPGGRHVQAPDARSWHLVMFGTLGLVTGCVRFRRHSAPLSWSQLTLRHAAIARSEEWGFRFRTSVDAELDAARRAGFAYVEVGGWALAKEIRFTTMALKTVLAIYAWSELLGGALGITTATHRNGSASILRRLGGRPLSSSDGAELPPYYDDRYRCQMEVLRFDSRRPNPRFRGMLNEVRDLIRTVPVIYAGNGCENRNTANLPESFGLVESEVAC